MSLAGFTRIAKYELPVITGVHTDFVVLLKFADFTTAALARLDDGGGDLRFSSDISGVTQLSCEPVSFDKVGSNIQVWVKVPSASTGTIIHIWGDNTGATQPAVGAAFGRNSVWVNYDFVVHGGTVIDSSGNLADGTLSGGLSTKTTGVYGWGEAYVFDHVDDAIVFSSLTSLPVSIQSTISLTTTPTSNEGIFGNISAANSGFWLIADDLTFVGANPNAFVVSFDSTGKRENTGANTAIGGANYMLHAVNGDSIYTDGLSTTAINTTTAPVSGKPVRIGAQLGYPSIPINGIIQETRISPSSLSSGYIATEYSNQSVVGAWGIMTDVGTGGSGTEQAIVVSSTEQLTQSQLVNILGIGAINAIVSEQKSQSQLVSVTEINQLNAITSEQKTQSTLIDISEINSVSAIVCEQLTQSVLVAVTANGAQSVNVIITEQKTQSELISIDEVASVNAITSEQLTQSNLVSIDESSGALVSVVIAEQKTQSELVSISAIANINPVICEQLTQSNIQQISVDITIDAIISEQLTQSQLITIVQSNIADALNIDIDQITIEMLTPRYKIEMLTPKYTIEHIH